MNSLLNIFTPFKKIDVSKREFEQEKGIRLICTNIAIRAFRFYLSHEFREFDALVGENNCQHRTGMLIESYHKNEIDKSRLSLLIEKLEIIRDQLLKTLSTFPEEVEFKDEFKEQEKFLILCHTLKSMRETHLNRLNSKSLESLLNRYNDGIFVEERYLKEISIYVKRQLADLSVKYIQNLEGEHQSILKKLLSQVEDANGQGLRCTAFYFGLKSLFEKLKKYRTTIIISTEKEKLIFQFDESQKLQRIKDPSFILEDPAFVVECHINQEQEARAFLYSLEPDQVIDFILNQSADHPLFAGKRKDQKLQIFENPEVKPHLMTCQGQSLEEIQLNITQKLSPRHLRMANSVCKPSSLDQVIFAFCEMSCRKLKGAKSKQIIEIQHIYASAIKDEL